VEPTRHTAMPELQLADPDGKDHKTQRR